MFAGGGLYFCSPMRYALLLLTLVAVQAFGQSGKDRRLVQFSGVVVTGDSLEPVPFASVVPKGSFRGTLSDVYGYFSFVAQAGDTIQFSAVGFKRGYYAIPDTLKENKYSMIHVLFPDTVLLEPLSVYPWPSREQFRDAFLNLDLAQDDYQHALRNLNAAEVLQRMENLPPDPGLAYHYQSTLNNTRIYNQGMAPTINLFNPIAWAQFLQAWKAGDFKKKKR
jgi:hypothetical protein